VTRTATSAWTLALTDIVYDFEVLEAKVSLDENNTVYCHATITVAPYPSSVDDDVTAAIEDGTQRATVAAALEILTPTPVSQARSFDLYLHERRKNEDESVTFELGSDEVELEVRGLVTDYRKDYHTSATDDTARAVIDRVLDDYLGAALEAGTVDATTTRTLGLTNLIVNPSFEVDIASWSSRSNASGLTRSTAQSSVGSASLRWTATASGDSGIQHDPVTIARSSSRAYYYARAAIRSTVARLAHITIQQLDASGAIVDSTASASVTTSTSNWTAYAVVVNVIDPRVVSLRLLVYGEGNAAGNQHYVDEVSLYLLPSESYADDEVPGPFDAFYTYALTQTSFDGSKTDAYYNYNWTGTAHASPSVRSPKDSRGFQLCLMQPGQTARDFLDPIVGVTGGRLFCDENRDWRLVDDTYVVAGMTDIDYITRATDTVSSTESFDGIPAVFTGVVVEYEVVNPADGSTRTRYDAAGDNSGRVYRKPVQGGYPGPGEAAAILARVQHRSYAIAALVDLTVTPAKAITFTQAGTDYAAIASSVEWTWSQGDDSDEMTITPRNLVAV
jgi:hypothetical protein